MFLLPNQVLYDDVLVFHLETAITENTGRAKKTISSYLSIFFCKKYSLLYVYPLKLLTQTAVSRKKITILNMAYFSKYIYIYIYTPGHYSGGRWNQFRLFSSYKSNFTMRATLMGSSGGGGGSSNNKVVAVDNFVVKMITNNTEGNRTK